MLMIVSIEVIIPYTTERCPRGLPIAITGLAISVDKLELPKFKNPITSCVLRVTSFLLTANTAKFVLGSIPFIEAATFLPSTKVISKFSFSRILSYSAKIIISALFCAKIYPIHFASLS